MAAVAAEPGAAAAAAGDEVEFELGAEAQLSPGTAAGCPPARDLCRLHTDADAVQECTALRMESPRRPDLEAAGSAAEERVGTGDDAERYRRDAVPGESPEAAANEVGSPESLACLSPSSIPDSQPSVVFLHSLPVRHLAAETGLTLAEPAEPSIVCLNPETIQPAGIECDYLGLDPEAESACDAPGATSDRPESLVGEDSESDLKPPHPRTEPETAARLVPGSEVRVSLDHIIDDALVVSFRLGEKIFSGVLMDLSKRFGPYGIPITVYPKREYKDKPESMQLKTFHPETEKGGSPGDAPDAPSKDPAQAPAELEPSPEPKPSPWTSKPPPLFHEGAPYPPPLFIRDTYNQSLPQPLPRKIKRPKRRLYREEPTSIMNAIKLRPRQVLCDKCKSAVAMGGDKRETRRGPVPDCRGDDAKRRRSDSAASVGKRPRHDHRSEEKVRGMDGAKRQAPSGGTAGSRVVRAASPANSSRVQLNAKKVLQSKNVDHSKARAVLKMAKAQQRQRDAVTGGNTKAMTRAAALQEAHQKVHFTRRLQQIGGAAPGNPLPPRMRIKPQRYRNEENDSSPCKPPCAEKVPGSGRLPLPKPAPQRCTSTRSSSSSCSTAEAGAGDDQGPAKATDPEPRPVGQSLVQSEQPETAGEHGDPEAEPEEQEGREERRDTRGSKAGSLVVYMTLNPNHPDSSNTSMCSFDSADELKSSNSECSSTETFDFPPPGELRSPPTPGTSSSATSAAAPKDKKKRGRSLKATVFSKNVSKCVALDGRTICVGDIVWAKIYGFPWWPARILAIQVSRKDTGLLVRQEARVAWFGSPTTSFLALAQLAPFLENFQSRFDKKRKGLYRKAITEAAKAAKQLTPEVRALLTQFET